MSLPERIRESAAAGDYGRAARLFEEYVGGLCATIRGGSCARSQVEDCRLLLDWCRVIMLAGRAQAGERLREVGTREFVAGAYR
jgi:hypothetical protein